jgi:transposase
MSQREVERLSVIKQVSKKQLKQGKAAEQLKISARQIRRMLKAYRQDGAQGLVSKHRGKTSNRRHAKENKALAMDLVHQRYADFGPTLAAEKLKELHGIVVNKETLRQWMTSSGLWHAKRAKKARIHQSRERRSCFGELIQLDGSHHDWFEGRSEKCCLYVLIDDATSQLVGLWFEAGETTVGYFKVVREYIERHGRPLAFYSDKDSVFRVNHPVGTADAQTQFERAMSELGIELICANSPQAKGRVERANGTLQDRLIKEMRLRDINTMEAANAFLPTFMADYNRRFAVAPRSEINAHRRQLPNLATLDLIFSLQDTRTLSKNLELSYKNVVYQIQGEGKGYRLRHAKVTVCEDVNGQIALLYKGRKLAYQCHHKQRRASDVVDVKQLNSRMDQTVKRMTKYIPKPEHPWRDYAIKLSRTGLINAAGRSSYPQGPQGA